MNTHQNEMQSLFNELADILRTEEHTDVDLMDVIAGFTKDPQTSFIGHAFLMHSRDILGTSTEDLNYTDIIIECYRRTFFDAEMAERYGTNIFINDIHMARDFVGYMRAMTTLGERESKAFHAFTMPQSIN